jgi:hypothetical protein
MAALVMPAMMAMGKFHGWNHRAHAERECIRAGCFRRRIFVSG